MTLSSSDVSGSDMVGSGGEKVKKRKAALRLVREGREVSKRELQTRGLWAGEGRRVRPGPRLHSFRVRHPGHKLQ